MKPLLVLLALLLGLATPAEAWPEDVGEGPADAEEAPEDDEGDEGEDTPEDEGGEDGIEDDEGNEGADAPEDDEGEEAEDPETAGDDPARGPGGKRKRARKPKKERPPGAPVVGLLPAIAYNVDDGFGLGIFGNVRWPSFEGEARRYRSDLGLNAKVWMKPRQLGWSGLFGFSFFPTKDGNTEVTFALTTWGRFWDWWFGVGMDVVRDRTNPDRGPDADDPFDRPIRDSFHRFGHFRVRGDAHVFHRIVGPLDGLGGISFSWNDTLIREFTLLHEQQDQLDGIDGGVTFAIDGGFRIDTRNNRVDPTRGGFALFLGQLNLGPERPWGRTLIDLRVFGSVFDEWLVFAGEALLIGGLGPIPFYELGVLPGWELVERTMVGQDGLRGLDRGRLRGPLGGVVHGELRLRPPGFNLLPTFRVRFAPVVWADLARVEATPDVGRAWAVQPGLGGGLRIFWNEVSVSRLDIGTGPERLVDASGERVRWTFGLYGTVGHAF